MAPQLINICVKLNQPQNYTLLFTFLDLARFALNVLAARTVVAIPMLLLLLLLVIMPIIIISSSSSCTSIMRMVVIFLVVMQTVLKHLFFVCLISQRTVVIFWEKSICYSYDQPYFSCTFGEIMETTSDQMSLQLKQFSVYLSVWPETVWRSSPCSYENKPISYFPLLYFTSLH